MSDYYAGPPVAIAFDGPSGTGKGTAGRNLRALLRRRGHPAVFHSTGWVWRLAAKLLLDQGLDPALLTGPQAIAYIVAARLQIADGVNSGVVTLGGVAIDVREYVDGRRGPLYTEEVTAATPRVSRHDDVRAYLNDRVIMPWIMRQQAVVIIEGRDTAATLNALWASAQIRAEPVGFAFERVESDELARRSTRDTAETIRARDELDSHIQTHNQLIPINTALTTQEQTLKLLDGEITSRYPFLGRGAVILFAGGPRSGKGTQAEPFAKTFGAPCISSGDLLRQLDAASQLGQDARLMHSGDLVSSDTFMGVASRAIEAVPPDQPIVLDGMAKKLGEAQLILELLERLERRLTVLVWIQIDEATMVQRNREAGRVDDSPAVQAERWRRYEEETVVSIHEFTMTNLHLITVNGRVSPLTVGTSIRDELAYHGLPAPE
jgi:adenylate kinase